MYQTKHQLLHLLASDRNPSSEQFVMHVQSTINTFALQNPRHARPETTEIRLESVQSSRVLAQTAFQLPWIEYVLQEPSKQTTRSMLLLV